MDQLNCDYNKIEVVSIENDSRISKKTYDSR